ncbi:MAG: SIMPL domain-containing protein [Gemmobacter sp.]
MNRMSRFFQTVVLVVAVALAPLTAMAEPMRLSLVGEGQVETRPDMASISIGVVTEARTAQEALRENSARVAAVLDRLRGAGIEDRDLQTSGLGLGPRMEYAPQRQPRVAGYQATNTVTVRVRDLAILGGVLDAAVADGANQLQGLSFGLSDSQPVMDEARRRAVADARRKAGVIAEAAGVKLGAIREISESGGWHAPQPRMRGMAMEAASDSVPVAEGEVSYSVSVSIVWDLLPD